MARALSRISLSDSRSGDASLNVNESMLQSLSGTPMDIQDTDAAYVETLLAEQARCRVIGIETSWSPARRAFAYLLKQQAFEVVLLIIIVLNMVGTVMETDARASGDNTKALRWVNRLFLSLYICELLIRLYVLRWKFFTFHINVLDITIVLVDIVTEILSGSIGNVPAASMLRLIRIARFLRAGHIIVFFPELYWMTRGMFCAMKALFWGVMLIIVVLMMWSIVAVEVLNPIMNDVAKSGVWDNCDHCETAFESVTGSLLTFYSQIVAGDSWGKISLPLIRTYPMRSIPILFGALFSINLGILNLILAVIVDRAQQAHQEDLRHILKVKAAEYKVSRQKLYSIVEAMDTDNSGQVSVSELLAGYDDQVEFRTVLQAMDITKEDLGTVFSIMDKDKSGTVDYQEFALQLHKMKTSDSHTLLIFIQAYVKELREKVATQIDMLKEVFEQHRSEIITHMTSDTRSLFAATNSYGLVASKSNVSTVGVDPPSFLSEGVNAIPAEPQTDTVVLEQLRQAVSELTDVMREASKKNLETREMKREVSLETREPKSIAPLAPAPVTPVESASCTWGSEAKPNIQGGAKFPGCCRIRVSEDGQVSRCV